MSLGEQATQIRKAWTGTMRLDAAFVPAATLRPVWVDDNVADLGFAQVSACEDSAVLHVAPAYSRSKGDVEQGLCAPPCTEMGFRKRRQLAIVLDEDRRVETLLQLGNDVNFFPSVLVQA